MTTGTVTVVTAIILLSNKREVTTINTAKSVTHVAVDYAVVNLK